MSFIIANDGGEMMAGLLALASLKAASVARERLVALGMET